MSDGDSECNIQLWSIRAQNSSPRIEDKVRRVTAQIWGIKWGSLRIMTDDGSTMSKFHALSKKWSCKRRHSLSAASRFGKDGPCVYISSMCLIMFPVPSSGTTRD